jgi:hypothetical protein
MQLLDLSGAVLQRQISVPQGGQSFQNYLTIEEDHRDETAITQHPVDSGAVMSDHIYLLPPTVKLRLGWSNADPQASAVTYILDTYAALLQLKNNRKLFTVFTGKRLYNNMFVKSLAVPTNPMNEWSMIADCELQQLLLVNTASTTGQPSSTTASASGNPSNLASPATNQSTTDTGTNYTASQTINAGGEAAPAGSPVISGFNNSPTINTGGEAAPAGLPNSNNGGAGPSQADLLSQDER